MGRALDIYAGLLTLLRQGGNRRTDQLLTWKRCVMNRRKIGKNEGWEKNPKKKKKNGEGGGNTYGQYFKEVVVSCGKSGHRGGVVDQQT